MTLLLLPRSPFQVFGMKGQGSQSCPLGLLCYLMPCVLSHERQYCITNFEDLRTQEFDKMGIIPILLIGIVRLGKDAMGYCRSYCKYGVTARDKRSQFLGRNYGWWNDRLILWVRFAFCVVIYGSAQVYLLIVSSFYNTIARKLLYSSEYQL